MEIHNQDRFINFLADVLERDEHLINIEDEFRDYEEWDSLALLSVMVMLEEEYSTSFKRTDLDDCITIGDLFQIIQSSS